MYKYYVSICPHLRRIRNNKQIAVTWTFRHESCITIGLAEHSAITFTYHNTSIFKKGAVDQSEWSQFNFGRVSPLKPKQIRITPNLSRMLCHRGKSLTAENDLAASTSYFHLSKLKTFEFQYSVLPLQSDWGVSTIRACQRSQLVSASFCCLSFWSSIQTQILRSK